MLLGGDVSNTKKQEVPDDVERLGEDGGDISEKFKFDELNCI